MLHSRLSCVERSPILRTLAVLLSCAQLQTSTVLMQGKYVHSELFLPTQMIHQAPADNIARRQALPVLLKCPRILHQRSHADSERP